MLFALFLAGLIAVMLGAPETPAARWLHRHMVEEPLRLAERFERKHVLFLVVGLVALQGFAMTLPAEMAMIMAWDLTVYVDLLIAGWTLSAFARLRAFKAWMAWQVVRIMPRRARIRARRVRRAATQPARAQGRRACMASNAATASSPRAGASRRATASPA